METKHSYLWQIKCYLIETKQNIRFYLFDGDTLPVNLYPIRENQSLDECYYLHIGLMTELCSRSVADNFIVDFLDKYSIFPILDRRITEISADITLNKNSSQLSGIWSNHLIKIMSMYAKIVKLISRSLSTRLLKSYDRVVQPVLTTF